MFDFDNFFQGIFGGSGGGVAAPAAAPDPMKATWFADWFQGGNVGVIDPWDPSTEEFWQKLKGRAVEAQVDPSVRAAPPLDEVVTRAPGEPVPQGDKGMYGPFKSDVSILPGAMQMPQTRDGVVVESDPSGGSIATPVLRYPGDAEASWTVLTPEQARRDATPVYKKASVLSEFRQSNAPKISLSGTWTASDPTWQKLDSHQRVAVMSLMESGDYTKADLERARNAAAAMHNRASKYGIDVGYHVSSRHYQPTFEPAQHSRLQTILKSKAFAEMMSWSQRYAAGQEVDPTNGATHFLVHPKTMLALEAREPMKYRSWRSWTGFDQASMAYRNQTMTDHVHAFLAPEGRFSIGRQFRK